MVNKGNRRFGLAFYASVERVGDIRDRAVSMTEAQAIDHLLQFANADSDVLATFVDRAVAAAEQLDAALSAARSSPTTDLATYTRNSAGTLQGWLTSELNEIASGSRVFTPLFRRASGRDPAELRGPIAFESILPRQERRYAFTSLEQFAHWALRIACDPDRPFAEDICRCHLSSCGNFFLATPTRGRTIKKYCSPAHRKLAQGLTGSDRVQASRAGMPVDKWRKLRKRRKPK